MNKRTFTKPELEAVYPNFPFDTKRSEIFDTTRWGEIYEVIFEFDDKFWRTYFEIEIGDSDYTYWDDYDGLDCNEVQPMQIVKTEWFNVE